MITLNPLVIDHYLLPANSPESTASPTYSITDQISTLPFHLWDSEITYTASFENIPSGLLSKTNAPMGVEIAGEWRLVASGGVGQDVSDEGFELVETATVTCNLFLMPYIKGTIKKSHDELRRRFEEILLRDHEQSSFLSGAG